jgi:signal transduction histidine kinase
VSRYVSEILPNGLGVRLFLALTLAIVVITLTTDSWRLRQEYRRVLAQLQREASLVAQAIEGHVASQLSSIEDGTMLRLLEDIRKAQGAECVAVYSLEGRRLVASFVTRTTEQRPDVCPVTVLPQPVAEAVFARWGHSGTYNLQLPLTPSDVPRAILKLVFDEARVSESFEELRNSILLERVLVLAAIGLMLWIGIALSVTRPIRRLIAGVEAIGRGQLDVRITPAGKTEIGNLADAFNQMAERLEEAQEQRRQAEERQLLAESQLRLADKLAAVGKLAGVIAHEIGTPLNVILGRTRILSRGLPEGDARTEDAEIIRSQVNRISQTVRQILKYSRPPSSRRESVDLCNIVREVATFLTPEVAACGMHLDISMPTELPTLVADPEGLAQVLLNLLMNALAAMSKGGKVSVEVIARLSDPSPGVELLVTDTGAGIRPDDLPHIFDPFFSTKDSSGTGLGLTICRDIVKEHHGTITVESEPGAGAKFRVWLPYHTGEVRHV